MTSERLKTILQNYVSFDLEGSDPAYVKEVLRDECGCTDTEIDEILYDKPAIMQYSIDVEDDSKDGGDMEKRIRDALEAADIYVVGIAWKARWTNDGYHHCEHPIDWD